MNVWFDIWICKAEIIIRLKRYNMDYLICLYFQCINSYNPKQTVGAATCRGLVC